MSNFKSINRYLKGMNQDTSKEKYNPNQYYSMSNFDIITDGQGLSTGSIKTTKGTLLSLILPDLPEMTLGTGDIIPAQANLKIIGLGSIGDIIIIISTNEESATPTNSYGQIWRVKYDEQNDIIEGILPSGELDPSIHLIYNNKINLSTYHRIRRIVGRYETTNKQRIYWTDNYNPVRTINIADPEAININPENLDLKPSIDFAQPIITGVGSGNIPTGSMVQYSYRLIDSSGAQTLYSPPSTVYPLTDSDIYSANASQFEGNLKGYASNRSVFYKINGLDTDYSVIEHIVIIYQDLNIPRIYKFSEQQIPASGNVEVIHTGNETYIEVSLVEFNALSSGFDKAKDLESNNNRLIAANTTSSQFDLSNFDARAYRFNSIRQALIKDASLGDIVINGVVPNWSVPEEHDAINPYNNENDVNWASSSQYKFQTDGLTYGGEGPNIKYKFVLHGLQGDQGGDTDSNHIQVSRWNPGTGDIQTLGVTNPDGSSQEIVMTNQLNSPHAPFAHSFYTSQARGEVYRYALVAFNKKGSPSFARWIADIRIPEPQEGFKISDTLGGSPYLYNLGIEFTIDVSSIAGQISGYSIVRVERKERDKTRLGTGMLMIFDKQDASYDSSLFHRIDGTGGSTNPFEITNDTIINGATDNNNIHLHDKPGFPFPIIDDPANNTAMKRYCYLISPLAQMDNVEDYSFNQGDFLKTLAYYRTYAYAFYEDTGDYRYGFHYKSRGYYPLAHSSEYFEIRAAKHLRQGEYIDKSDSFMTELSNSNNLLNASYCREAGTNEEVPFGLGHRKLAFALKSTPTINNGTSADSMNWIFGGDFNSMTFTGQVGSECWMKEVAYCRYITNQYGGNTYEDRSKNSYISTGHYQAVNSTTGSVFTQQVFGGDTYINYYDEEYCRWYSSKDLAFNEPYDNPVEHKLSVAIVAPCESSVNTAWRTGLHWANERDGGDATTFDNIINYYYNPVYQQQNNTAQKFFAKDFQSDFAEEQPHKLWASGMKINGERIDSWRQFKANEAIEVNGIYGPINKIINFRNNLFFYQDAAFGVASIKQRVQIPDEFGQSIILGTGNVLDYYSYISVNTGTLHQSSVVSTEVAIYHYDTRLKKVYRYDGSLPRPLSDIKGMSSYLDANITGSIRNTDLTTRTIDEGFIGVTAEYDPRFQRIFFTFLNSRKLRPISNRTNISLVYNVGDIVFLTEAYYEVITPFSLIPGQSLETTNPNLSLLPESFSNGFTLSLSEMEDEFEGFFDFRPPLYFNHGRRLFSIDPKNMNKLYWHSMGQYGKYYEQDYSTSEITLVINNESTIAKIFNNVEFSSEITLNNIDIFDESITSYRAYNEYQDTGDIILTVNDNLIRRIRKWRFDIDRDRSDNKSRMRNPWLFITLRYDNFNNKRLVLHDIIVYYTPSPY